MKNTFLLVSTLAASTSAWTYPDCERDGCYRNLIDRRYADAAPAFCLEWISGASTAVSVIPSRFRNCPDVAAVSSACSHSHNYYAALDQHHHIRMRNSELCAYFRAHHLRTHDG
ncbi:hypothetical protein CRV24_006429 [Beauveria bassiana]|nr:hypothetical protein CRV24_006429 [Beauveria bassiana]KAH8713446.1 hypothetical protein HC256_006604 [Beauveria bassiana]